MSVCRYGASPARLISPESWSRARIVSASAGSLARTLARMAAKMIWWAGRAKSPSASDDRHSLAAAAESIIEPRTACSVPMSYGTGVGYLAHERLCSHSRR